MLPPAIIVLMTHRVCLEAISAVEIDSAAPSVRQPFAAAGLTLQSFGALLVLVLAGCSSSTSPQDSVNGSWSYQASNLAGDGVSCSVSGATLILSQTGSTFTGTYTNAKITCQVGGQQAVIGTFNGNVVNGVVSGDSVSFEFDTSAFTNTGTISGASMSGSASATENVGGAIGKVTLSGQWDATQN
jgi:hypothetical protein